MGNNENFGQNQPPQQYQQQYQQPQNYGQPPQQQGYYAPQGPSIGQMLSKSPLAKAGLIIMILAIIGLIISFAVPWGYVDEDGLDEKTFGHDLENKDDIFLFGGESKDFDYMADAPGSADLGLIFLLIIGIMVIILGIMEGMYKQYSTWLNFSIFILGVIALLPCLMILTTGFKFVGYNISYALNESETTYWFPAAYILLIFGILFFLIILFKFIKGQSAKNIAQNYFFTKEVR